MSINITTEAPAQRPPSRAIYWLVAILLSGGLLYYSLRGIAWPQVWTLMKSARLGLVALAMGLTSLALLLRSLRWRVLLSAQVPVQVGDSFWATAAGYLGNNLLPARAGEMIRTLLISRRTGATKAFVLTTALSERVVDAAVLVSITAGILLLLPQTPAWLTLAMRPFAVLGVTSVVALSVLPFLEGPINGWIGRLPLRPTLRSRLVRLTEQAFTGVMAFHHRERLTHFLLFTALIWFMDGVIVYLVAQAISVPMTLPMAFLLVAGLGLGSALPSTPGFVGIYQFIAVSVLTPFGLTQAEAIAHILLLQTMNYAVVVGWGVLGLNRLSGQKLLFGHSG